MTLDIHKHAAGKVRRRERRPRSSRVTRTVPADPRVWYPALEIAGDARLIRVVSHWTVLVLDARYDPPRAGPWPAQHAVDYDAVPVCAHHWSSIHGHPWPGATA